MKESLLLLMVQDFLCKLYGIYAFMSQFLGVQVQSYMNVVQNVAQHVDSRIRFISITIMDSPFISEPMTSHNNFSFLLKQ